MSEDTTQTRIEKDAQKALKNLSSRYEMTQVEFLTAAIDYFRKTGINPKDKPEGIREETKKVENRLNQVISFIRTHEKERLNPLLSELIEIKVRLKDLLPPANSQIATLEHLKAAVINLKKQNEDQQIKLSNSLVEILNEIKITIKKNSEKATQFENAINEKVNRVVEQTSRKGLFS